jgi:chromosome segregation ATPase
MEILALGIAVLALIVGILAVYRSRDQGVSNERLSSSVPGPSESTAAQVRDRYDHNQRMIDAMRERIASIKEEALDELREDLQNLTQRLERLAERAKRELRDLKSGVDSTVLQMEIGLRLTVDEAKAHLKLIEAKRELLFAHRAAARNDLPEAQARVAAALRYIDEAQALALGHHDNLAALQRQAQSMLAALGTEADTTRRAIEALLEQNNRLLAEMDESRGAAKDAAQSGEGMVKQGDTHEPPAKAAAPQWKVCRWKIN